MAAPAGQCVTVVEFISNVLRKELLHIWLEQDPTPLDPEAVGDVVATWSPAIAEEIIKLVKGWIPGLLLTTDSTLNDFRNEGNEDASGLAASYVAEPARLTVCETLQGFFDTVHFAAEPPHGSAFAVRPDLMQRCPPWLLSEHFRLPADSVFCLSAEIGPVLLRAPCDDSLVDDEIAEGAQAGDEEVGIEIGPLIGSPRGEVPRPEPGSREELLAKQLQNYQSRIFLLERELMVRSRSEKSKVAYEKSEKAKAEARLMEINSQLEERLKARTEDLRKTGQKLVEAQRSMNNTKWQLEDKTKQITKFEYKEEITVKEQQGFLDREKNLSKRLLRLAIQEDSMKQREEFRIDKLRGWLKGENETQDLSEADANINMQAALEKLEQHFELAFNRRQEKFQAALHEHDRKLEEKRNQYNALSKEVSRMDSETRKRADNGQDSAGSSFDQVRGMILAMDSRDLEKVLQSETQLWSKVNEAMRKS